MIQSVSLPVPLDQPFTYRLRETLLAQVRHGIDSFRYFRHLDGAKWCRFNKSF